MNKPQQGVAEYKLLHQSGRLAEAKQGYLAILKQSPRDVDALHLLAIVYAEEGDLSLAQSYLEKAIEIDPGNPSLRMHLANILKAKGLYAEATQLLLAVIELHPNLAAAYNNLGTVYYAEANFVGAINAYQKAIDIQSDYIDAYYNLGLALGKARENIRAMSVYESLLSLVPQHAGGQFQLGCLYMQQGNFKKAAEYFSRIERIHPFHFETQSNLAACYIKMGLLNEAKSHNLKALEIMPDDTQILFNLGVINMQQGRMKEASQYYLQVVKLNSDDYNAHNNLGIALLSMKEANAALLHFREALRIQPHNEAIRHTVNIIAQKDTLSVSPPEYIRSLFDSYADHYDSHLVHALNYHVPALIYQAVAAAAGNTPNASLDILDLGCGTGLCGALFKAKASTLIGVDISEKMLAMAAQKNCYDDLVCAEVVSFLHDKKSAYDLIVAGDVLVYMGDLAPLFDVVSVALRSQGRFVFNTEISDKGNYHMTASGRFAHSKEYVDRLAAENSLSVLQSDQVVIRMQEDVSVLGYLYVLRQS